jgi:hypothetical protein
MLARAATRNSVTSAPVILRLSSSRLWRALVALHRAGRPDATPCASAPLVAVLVVATACAALTAPPSPAGLDRLSVSAAGSLPAVFAYRCRAASRERRRWEDLAVQRAEPSPHAQERLRMLRATLRVHDTTKAAAHAAAAMRNAARGSIGGVGACRASVP